jgi:hypothetical protein
LLDPNYALAGNQLDNAIDEKERVAVGQELLNR